MKTINYSFKTAFKSIWHEKWLNLLTIMSISIGLSILCSFVLVTLNMDSLLKRWTKSFGMIVYLEDGLTKERELAIENRFQKDADVLEVKYISNEQALSDVREALGENALLLDVFDENPLPSSFELKIKSDLLTPERVKGKAKELGFIEGVKEVQYGEKWLASLNTITKVMKIGAVIFGLAIFIAITFITYSTIKIFFYRRKDDMETMKLLGAPRVFIRLPFLIEGLFIGTIGGLLSAAALFGLYSFTSTRITEFMPSIGMVLTSLPIFVYLVVPFSGALMSFMGSYIAVGKIRY